MADYYSLLARAVANLPKPSPPSARQAIYERARGALINQLRSLKPQLPDSDIAREEAALDTAIARLEAEHAAPSAPVRSTPPPRPPRPPPPARTEASPRAALSPPPASRPAPPPPASRPPLPPIPSRASPPAPASTRPPPATTPSASRVVAAPIAARAPLASESAQLVATTGAPRAAPRLSTYVSSPLAGATARKTLEETRRVAVTAEAVAETQPDNAPKIGSPIEPEAADDAAARVESEPPRPPAPAPRGAPRINPWLWVVLAMAVGLIGSVAVAAFLLREKPQDLSIKDSTRPAIPAAAPANGQKIAQRVDGATPTPEPTPAATPSATPAAAPSATPVAAPVASPSPSPVATPAAEATPAASPSPQPATQAPIPVAGRAAMLVADGADTQKPTVTLGSVVWSVAPAIPGQPGSTGVKAEIDIPDLRMHASMVLRRNVDPGLPASHTIDFRVTFDPGSPIKGVKDIALPLMRRDDPPAADALIGVRVKINDGYYLVGLNRADADVARNIEDIGSRGWFDFPMQLTDDRIAKLTFEKGVDGERIVAAALASWK